MPLSVKTERKLKDISTVSADPDIVVLQQLTTDEIDIWVDDNVGDINDVKKLLKILLKLHFIKGKNHG